jgi:N-acetylmuramoyl-L-alanine amidase
VKKPALIFRLILLLLLPAALGLAGAVARADTRPPGRDYVRLFDWARANGFTTRWLDRDKTVALTNHQARLVFNIDPRQDSRKAQINGVAVWLAFPLLYQNGSVSISRTDLAQTLRPVLFPPTNVFGLKIKTICIDPGHGGNDPGYQVGTSDEKKYTLLLAQEMCEQLKKAGFNVVLTRTTDTYIKLPGRPELARRHNADLFVSVHFNSDGPQHKEVRGIEVYCLTPEGAFSTNAGGEGDTRPCTGNRQNEKNMLLAYQMQLSLTRNLSTEDRGVHRARFKVLSDATMPAILIEGGFMSNPTEGRRIFDSNYRRQMARAIVNGILVYQRAVKG